MKKSPVSQIICYAERRGSTLVIVIAMLGLLTFMGMVFYSFSVQDRANSENFSEAAKANVDEPPNVFDHALRQLISGPGNSPAERISILHSTTRRHSLVNNLVGYDVAPHSGEGVEVRYDGAGTPIVWVDLDGDGMPDPPGSTDWLEFVDSPAARAHMNYQERGLEQPPIPNPPAPDVDYTYPDINNLFLAYKGLAIRDNGPAVPPGTPRFEQVPVIIPSFFRPQYLKTPGPNGPAGSFVPTDANWATAFDGVDRLTAPFPARSFRPHPLHITGRLPDDTPVFRYLTDMDAAGLGIAAGGFPFVPADDTNSGNGTAIRGELGIWTGSHPEVYELDVDNDGDGIREGIWMDLNYPVQETATGDLYVILHSFTIYDLDALIDVNVHGNLAGLNRIDTFFSVPIPPDPPPPLPIRDGLMSTQFLSRSNLGLGPNEINPLWAMRRGAPPAGHPSLAQFNYHFNRTPANDLEQANMEWFWLLMGRGDLDFTLLNPLRNLYTGRWGQAERLFNAIRPGGGTFRVEDLPRPGSAGNAQQVASAGIRFGGDFVLPGRNGFDDNQDRFEGEMDLSQGRLRAFGHPMDYAGTGRSHTGLYDAYDGVHFAAIGGSPRQPLLHHDGGPGPERWLGYRGYSINRAMTTGIPRYMFGQNGIFDGAIGDDLIVDPFFDALFEDPLETIFDVDFAQRQFDQIFGPQDLLSLHLTPLDKSSSPDDITERLSDLAPYAFENVLNNDVRERFTTLSNSLRRLMLKHDLGPDLQFGTADDGPRAWEFTADTDGADRNGDGYGDGDGFLEFPPAFGNLPANGRPYSPTDPFRPQVRRLLTVEAGENRQLFGQLPLSINHILDVERNAQTPDELAQPTQFLHYMQRAGLRFRPLTEHPDYTEGPAVQTMNVVPNYDPAVPVLFPPATPEDREYWARRDRQKLCRDIYVLLYTTGGAQGNGGTGIRDYRLPNIPSAPEGTALYTHQQLREMAQLAVNLVDAMDTDNVITKFEYDKDLSDGWNLDDDPYTVEGGVTLETDPNFNLITDSGRFREDSETRGVVYGVEAQQLAFAEVLGIRSGTPSMDHPATMHPDDMGRNHLFIELQNMLPTPADLVREQSLNMDSAIWRIVRYDRTDLNHPIGGLGNGGNPFRAMAFRYAPALIQQVDGGLPFTISMASTPDVVSSDFYVDFNLDGTFDLIAPNLVGPPLPTNATSPNDPNAPELKPRCDLDLIHPDHTLGFTLVDDGGNLSAVPGDFLTLLEPYTGNTPMTELHGGNFNAAAGVGFDLVLQRRANPNLPLLAHGFVPGEDPNPWVDVDYVRVEFRDFDIQDGDTAAQLQNDRLPMVMSDERIEPLDDRTRQPFDNTVAGPDFRFNTIGIPNSRVTIAGFQLWQPHFDRDYSSPGELLNLPLFGPGLLTQMLDRSRYAPYQQSFADPITPDGVNPIPRLLAGAAAKFLRPDFPDDLGVTPEANRARDNRWYRLFQFVEVPSRVHRMLGNYVTLDRLPGKMNLNTIRHWEVYAGLVDNPILMDREPFPLTGRFTSDRTPNPSAQIRDRWVEYLRARDGAPVLSYDPNVGTQLEYLIPGTPGSQPFRSPGYRAQGTDDDGSEATVFRRLNADVDAGLPENNRHWLEVGDETQHRNPGTTNTLHQHQLLSKIMNNTTTVSNTFIVYSTAAYFAAVEDPPNSGMIRVGGRIDLDGNDDQNPGWQQRAVFIIERTEAFRAFDPGSGDFDWIRLVKHRATIE